MTTPPFDAVAGALDGVSRMTGFALRSQSGVELALEVDRWMAPPDRHEDLLLSLAVAPVLDVGCGPGRHTLALQERGVGAIGLDEAPSAVRLASRRGAPAILGSVFDPVPGTGRWGTVLLLDGNVGIGGDPATLLRRVRQLLRPGGRLLVELDPADRAESMVVEVFEGSERHSRWFPWAVLGAGGVSALATPAGLHLSHVWPGGTRWFASLDAV